MTKKAKKLINVNVEGKIHQVPYNTLLVDFLKDIYSDKKEREQHIAAIVNNRLYGLNLPIRADIELKPITIENRQGQSVYRRSASLILLEAIRRLYPDKRPVIGQSIQDGYFFQLRGFNNGIHNNTIKEIEKEMRKIVAEDIPFEVKSYHVNQVKQMLQQKGQNEKVNLLRIHWEPRVRIVRCGTSFDLFHDPFAPSTGYIKNFKIDPYWPGLVLRFPTSTDTDISGEIQQYPKLFKTYMETRDWNSRLGVVNLGELNGRVLSRNIFPIVQVSEGFHEKKIASIADQITEKQPEIRLILIAGPSASGKTTFSKRLAVQLMVNGIRPVTLEMDNFFVERSQTPVDEYGEYDFESIDSIDLELFNSVLIKLLAGETTKIPVFDFKKGGKIPKSQWIPQKLARDQVLIVEGIHGLNDKLTPSVLAHRKFKIYISALTQLCIDDHNRIFTSDTRLIRRIVRDRRYRNYDAAETIKRWPSVRKGEKKHIFPFQERADVMFNSALVYEPGILKTVCERALLEVSPNDDSFPEAYRLLRFLRLVMPISK
ncbi:MAG: nucleoside kinase, partial [Deltaproteobacteria bacterium]|nr:nucleoside kinase [Deltaproteobacteria bacterium]